MRMAGGHYQVGEAKCATMPPKIALPLSLKMYSIIYEPTSIHAPLCGSRGCAL